MKRFSIYVLLALLLAVAGCRDGKLRTEGRVVKGGQAFVPHEGEELGVYFVPVLPDGRPPNNYYVTTVDQTTGAFQAAGADLRGMPPGKYRVGVQLIKTTSGKGKGDDLFHGKYDAKKSQFLFDIDSSTKEVVIDLDKPMPGKNLQ